MLAPLLGIKEEINMKKFLNDWTMFEKVWLVSATVIMLVLSFIWKDSLIGMTASLTGMLCVVLVAKGKVSNYYFGIVNVGLYAYLSYQQGFYGEVMLNALYFLPMQFIGLYIWKKRLSSNGDFGVKVSILSNKEKSNWAIAAVVSIIAYAFALNLMGGNLVIIDSTTTILQIIAMVLMVKRVKEQWLIWIVVNVLSIGMWFYAFLSTGDDVSILVMWTAYLFNSIYGYVKWRKAEREAI